MGGHPLAGGKVDIGEEALVARNEPSFEERFGETHGGRP